MEPPSVAASTVEPAGPRPAGGIISGAARPEFAAIYERHVAAIYRYCYVRLRDEAAAQDATSETFLRALRGFDRYRGGMALAWLYRIARSVVADLQRARRPTEPLEAAAGLQASVGSLEDQAVAKDEWRRVQQLLARLTDTQRTVVELHLAGWSTHEIAEVLQSNAAAVRQLRFRALRRVARWLRPRDGTDQEGTA